MSPTDGRRPGLVWYDHPEPARPPERLSRARVVQAAMTLADQEPSGEITMRALAGHLGARSPMALYRHVPNKEGLDDLMVDEAYGLMAVPTGGGWRAALHGLGSSGWEVMQRHPWAARLAYRRPPIGPHAVRLFDAALGELDPLGLDASTRMGFVETVLGHVLGAGLALLEERGMRARAGHATDADLDRAVAPYLARIVASGEYPHFARWVADPRRHDPKPQTFEQILQWILDGLETLSRTGAGG
ncbi:MAG TPA: TetR/AcrR family transcriptional regulator C-terminal domain-containing protein [Acidimicrobiales bacterium]|nr:TetR/AcrR family transcriptional regulator C-terminal domain-containing protein [Acidimicrobiales bacterium]